MAFDSLLCAGLETALNGVINKDTDSQRRLARLKRAHHWCHAARV